jgi:aminopeptidase N
VIELNGFNPQIASRQLAPLTRWRKYDSARQALMKGELEDPASGSTVQRCV